MRRRATVGAAVIAGAVASYNLVVKPWQLRWGATDEEFDQSLPGDGLIETPDLTATRAITIRAPAETVWPWIAQLGQGRGGFYSYDFLENLLGCHIHSTDRVVPEWQVVSVGGQVKLAPDVRLTVAVMERGRALVLRGGVPIGHAAPPYDFSWAFVLQDQLNSTTRLVLRERYAYRMQWARYLVGPTEAVSFVMTQKMLRGIKNRAEHVDDPDATPERLPAQLPF